MTKKFKVLLYYKYVKLRNPEQIMLKQKELCQALNLKGRIIIAKEGINGTVAGTLKNINAYIAKTSKIKAFSGMEWKESWANEQVFPKLKIVVRDEIVTLGLKKKSQDVPIFKKAHYIEPEEVQGLYENSAEFIMIDARNIYEAKVGKFKNALVAPIDNFRDFPKFAKKLTKYKDKEVVTYCTGGIRCEKASAYLRLKGFKKVRQLHGGIHEYAKKAGGKYFEGEMFVFDKRLHVPVNQVNPTILTSCIYCQVPITRLTDCAVFSCHSLFTCCQSCQGKYNGTCSKKCLNALKKTTMEPNTKEPQFNQFL